MQLEKSNSADKVERKTVPEKDTLISICSTREAAESLGVSQRTIQLWVESGVLKAWKTPGGHRKISLRSVEKIIQNRKLSIEMQDYIKDEFNILYIQSSASPLNLIHSYFLWAMHKVKVQLVENAFDGIVSLSRNRPDLLIIDVEMAEINSLNVLQHIKSNQEFSGIEIVTFTSMPAHLFIKDVGLQQKVKVFEKPISVEYLEKHIKSLMAKKHK